jgi:hypothetical protein
LRLRATAAAFAAQPEHNVPSVAGLLPQASHIGRSSLFFPMIFGALPALFDVLNCSRCLKGSLFPWLMLAVTPIGFVFASIVLVFLTWLADHL